VRQQLGADVFNGVDPEVGLTALKVLAILSPFSPRAAMAKREKRDAAINDVRKTWAESLAGKGASEDLRQAKLAAIEAQREFEESSRIKLPVGSYSFDFAKTQLQSPELTKERIENLLLNQTAFNTYIETGRAATESVQPSPEDREVYGLVVFSFLSCALTLMFFVPSLDLLSFLSLCLVVLLRPWLEDHSWGGFFFYGGGIHGIRCGMLDCFDSFPNIC
jgi:hypothetical protein